MLLSVLPCSQSPCENGGICTDVATISGYMFSCNCPATHTGLNCNTGNNPVIEYKAELVVLYSKMGQQ